MAHSISLSDAITLTTNYRNGKRDILKPSVDENILPICETFDRAEIDSLLAQTGCEKLRLYFGLNEDENVCAILVGVNENDEDMIPSTDSEDQLGTRRMILERGHRCPPLCPPKSALNS